MEAASSLILTNQTGPVNHELSSHAPFLKLPSQASMKTLIYSKSYKVDVFLTSN